MPKEYSPTWSARAISSSRCAIRSSGPTMRPVEGSVTAETKLSIPRCTQASQSGRRRTARTAAAGGAPAGGCGGGVDRNGQGDGEAAGHVAGDRPELVDTAVVA